MEHNLDLVRRFINDCKLPIQPVQHPDYPDYFSYMLDLTEEEFGGRTKWDSLKKVISERFSNNPALFLDYFYKTREEIIQSVKNDQRYIDFNNGSMDAYKLCSLPQYSKGNIYNQGMVGKRFLSIDLRKANFQALKYSGVLEDDTYEDFIRRFTDLDYIIESKYLRVVVFGQLNPSRHITVEKYLMSKVYNYLDSVSLIPADKLTLIKLESDELIFLINDESFLPDTNAIISSVLRDCGLDVKADSFYIRGYDLENKTCNAPKVSFYAKEYLDGKKKTYHCIPGIYYPTITKLLLGQEISQYDRLFEYEGQPSAFIGDYRLNKIGN